MRTILRHGIPAHLVAVDPIPSCDSDPLREMSRADRRAGVALRHVRLAGWTPRRHHDSRPRRGRAITGVFDRAVRKPSLSGVSALLVRRAKQIDRMGPPPVL